MLRSGFLAATLLLGVANIAVAQDSTWTGAYVGVLGGAAFGSTDFDQYRSDLPLPQFYPAGPDDDTSALLTVRLGYDKQFGSIVAGAFVDASFLKLDTKYFYQNNDDTTLFNNELDFLMTAEGRLGFEPVAGTLVYGHGGFAYASAQTNFRSDTYGSRTMWSGDDRTGFAVGAGVEHSLTENLSVVADYSYVELGKEDIWTGSGTYTVSDEITINTLKAGINWRF